MAILILAEHNHHELKGETARTVTMAKELPGDIHVLITGHKCQEVAQAAAKISGVSQVLVMDDAQFAQPGAEVLADLLVAQAEAYEYILAPATSVGKSVLPRVAALLDVAQISEVSAVVEPKTFVRAIYAGNVFATVRSKDSKIIATVRTTAFDSAELSGEAPINSIPAPTTAVLTTVVEQQVQQSERPELTSARVIVSGGRGLGSEENFAQYIQPLADRLHAAIGASRAAVDAGYVPNDYQVGQTGKIVAPELYIAAGISGAIQHLSGMKDSKVIVAINNDVDAPIFQVADYGIVGDLFTVLPELTARLGD